MEYARTKWTRLIGEAVLLCILLVGLAPPESVAQVVINQNGDFEQSTAGQTADLLNWQLLLGNGATVEVVQDPADSENLVLRVEITDISVAANPWDIQIRHYAAPELPLVEGHDYYMSLRVRAENPATATVQLDGETGAQLWGQSISGSDWTTLETGVFTAGPSDARVIAIHFASAGNQNGQVFYVDDLQVIDMDAGLSPVIVEAEEGEVGAEFVPWTDESTGITYISIATNVGESTGTGDFPGDDRIATYQVTFPHAGRWELYSLTRVGTDAFNDDSFFYGNGFGEKDPANANDWIMVNQLAEAGFSNPDDYIDGPGVVGNATWKWVNHSRNQLTGEAPLTFDVEEGNLTVTFQIGARENGLDIDKFAFGPADVFFTVANLNNGEDGVREIPTEPPPPVGDGPLARDLDKWLGSVHSTAQLPDFTEYWNQVTPENAGKWGSVEGSRDAMNWGALDAAYNLAKENGLVYRHHVLIWGAQQPGWMLNLPAEEQLEELREWFEAVAERYPDIDYLEVVNEFLHDPPSCEHPNNIDQNGQCRADSGNYMEALGGSGETGWDWVITAFEMAREIFPSTTKLMLNDYGILSNPGDARRYRDVANLLVERGLIDAIGVQGHAFSTRSGQFQGKVVLDILAETGLEIQVTEMDVDGNPNAGNLTEEQSDTNQLNDMMRIFPVIWEHPSVVGITFWGWRPGLWRTDQEAYLVRQNGEERPALQWLREYLASYTTAVEEEEILPGQFALDQNYPNPFNPATQIDYHVTHPTELSLTVYDVLGRQVAVLLANKHHSPGTYSVTFDARELPSGVYIYQLSTGSNQVSRRMVLLK